MKDFFKIYIEFTVLYAVAAYFFFPMGLWLLPVFLIFIVVGIYDMNQTRHAIKRNFPLLGRLRYVFEMIRPEISQYFIESNTDGAPINRENRSIVYQRSKKAIDSIPFGTQLNVYESGYEFVGHALYGTHIKPESLRVIIGGDECKKPYDCSIFNISAMSYGALSKNAVLALNGGAKDGNFAHNTGEGGISPYHLENSGDLIWQIGTGYFGCRNRNGEFDEILFAQKAVDDRVKMIEIKLSQGAKPGHGGILPKQKLTPEIAAIRHVELGHDVLSPPNHSAFSNSIEMMKFIRKLRDLSGGKPVGIKLCLGRESDFIDICHAMKETGITPDFIAIDGAEGGTGAAPLEFSNYIGMPGVDALIFANNMLKGFGLRQKVKIFTTGKVTTGFGLIKLLSLGADAIYAARPFMLSLGCIQALRCNSNDCPAGVATQNPRFVRGLVVTDKRVRVKNFHHETLRSASEILGAMGVKSHKELTPAQIKKRIDPHTIKGYDELYPQVIEKDFLSGKIPSDYEKFFPAQLNII